MGPPKLIFPPKAIFLYVVYFIPSFHSFVANYHLKVENLHYLSVFGFVVVSTLNINNTLFFAILTLSAQSDKICQPRHILLHPDVFGGFDFHCIWNTAFHFLLPFQVMKQLSRSDPTLFRIFMPTA